MRCSTTQHPWDGGIDRHARSMYVCIVSHDGAMLLHRHLTAAPDPFLKALAPYRDGLVVAVEGIVTWYGLADLCAEQGIPFVLGHALFRQAIHGGKAKNDQIDSPKLAVLLRGGMLPQASGYPAQMHAPRDRLRRRPHLRQKRSALLSHVPHTHSQSTMPESGKKIASQANREGVAERFDEAAVPKNLEVDLALIPYDDDLLRDLDLSIVKPAKQHDATTLYVLQTVPGIGQMRSLVLLYAIHRIARFPRVQEVASSCRLLKGRQESGGTRVGTAGTKIGNAHLTWAVGEAAACFLRHYEAGQTSLARLETTPDQGKALSLLAHQLARAVYDLLKRQGTVDMDIFLRC